MKLAAFVLAGAALALSGPVVAQSACSRPAAPTVLAGVEPSAVTMEQLLGAKKEVSAFIGASDAFQTCLLDDLNKQRAAAKAAQTKVDPAVEAAAKADLDGNQADKEAVGAAFNAAVKAYKAAHPA